jgi:hypothetical protein
MKCGGLASRLGEGEKCRVIVEVPLDVVLELVDAGSNLTCTACAGAIET